MSEVWAAAAAGLVVDVGSSMLNKPKAAGAVQYQNVDPTQVQNNAIAGDQGSLGAATSLAGSSTTAEAQSALAARNITQPGYSALAGGLSKQAQSLADNPYQVPQSVVDQLSQYAAENNISEGTGNASGFSQNNLLRSLGINALQYGQSNLSAATSALSVLSGTAPNVSPVSPLSFMLTPGQALGAVTNNNTQNQAVNQGAANANAAASNAGSANLWDAVAGQAGNAGSLLQQGTNYVQTANQAGSAAGAAAATMAAGNPANIP